MSRDPRVVFVNKWSRRLHRWGALLAALPGLVIISTGLLLQLKKHWGWVQPPTQRGQPGAPSLSLDQILAIARAVPEAGIEHWGDIERLDVQPGRALVKVQPRSRVEVQIDTTTGRVLHVGARRSDLIESMHDGTWFHDAAKLWVFLPAGVVLWGLWASGIYLWLLPYSARRARDRRAASARTPR